jgi:hypothetical protein
MVAATAARRIGGIFGDAVLCLCPGVDGRVKPDHDEIGMSSPIAMTLSSGRGFRAASVASVGRANAPRPSYAVTAFDRS